MSRGWSRHSDALMSASHAFRPIRASALLVCSRCYNRMGLARLSAPSGISGSVTCAGNALVTVIYVRQNPLAQSAHPRSTNSKANVPLPAQPPSTLTRQPKHAAHAPRNARIARIAPPALSVRRAATSTKGNVTTSAQTSLLLRQKYAYSSRSG